jgi:predicted membrane protein
MNSGSRPVITPRTIVGFGIAFVGVALVLDRLDLLHAERVLRYWPVGLILIGALMIVQGEGGQRTRGIIFAGIGTWLFLAMQDLLPWRLWELFWPLLLVFIGLSMAMRPRGRHWGRMRERMDQRFEQRIGERVGGGPGTASGPSAPIGDPGGRASFTPNPSSSFGAAGAGFANADNSPNVSIFSIMSGVKRASNASPFRGGDITAFMGGAHLDLRMAQIPPGGEAVIDVTTIMGGVEIAIPSTWAVATPIVPFMGAIEDKRLPPLPVDGRIPVPDANTPRLVIRGFVMMGNVELKS